MRFSVESLRARKVEMHAVAAIVDARLLITRYRTRLCQFIFIVHDQSPHGFVVLEPEDDATDAL